MFVTNEELQQLTGFKSRACQRRWCLQNGVQFMQRGDGSLVISKQHIEELLGSSSHVNVVPPEPDYSTLK